MQATFITIQPHYPYSQLNVNDNNDATIRLLQSLNHAKVLHLCSLSTKIIAKQLRGDLSMSLSNLENLNLYTSLFKNEVKEIGSFILRTPDLRTLFLIQSIKDTQPNSTVASDIVSSEYWESLNHVFIHQLKMVKVSVFGSGGNNFLFLKCLVKHVKLLKELTILYSLGGVQTAQGIRQKLKK
ncbi:hypothetical protein GIB67_020006, partial [Kingdonia uniflora]